MLCVGNLSRSGHGRNADYPAPPHRYRRARLPHRATGLAITCSLIPCRIRSRAFGRNARSCAQLLFFENVLLLPSSLPSTTLDEFGLPLSLFGRFCRTMGLSDFLVPSIIVVFLSDSRCGPGHHPARPVPGQFFMNSKGYHLM